MAGCRRRLAATPACYEALGVLRWLLADIRGPLPRLTCSPVLRLRPADPWARACPRRARVSGQIARPVLTGRGAAVDAADGGPVSGRAHLDEVPDPGRRTSRQMRERRNQRVIRVQVHRVLSPRTACLARQTAAARPDQVLGHHPSSGGTKRWTSLALDLYVCRHLSAAASCHWMVADREATLNAALFVTHARRACLQAPFASPNR